jgi:hypothetical protein
VIVINGIYVTYFATSNSGQSGNIGLKKGVGGVHRYRLVLVCDRSSPYRRAAASKVLGIALNCISIVE